jgi:hypothetical protein
MFGQGNDAALGQHHVFSQHAVHVASQSAAAPFRCRWTIEPILHEDPSHPLANLYGVYALAHLDHFTRSIGAGNTRQWHLGVVMTGDHEQVTIVQRHCMNLYQHFSTPGGRPGHLC